MAQKIEFKFEIDQRVKTTFGDEGIVESLAFDDGGVKYYVARSENSMWIKEKNLSPCRLISAGKVDT